MAQNRNMRNYSTPKTNPVELLGCIWYNVTLNLGKSMTSVTSEPFVANGIDPIKATELVAMINTSLQNFSAEEAWHAISKNLFRAKVPFALHEFLFNLIYPQWHKNPLSAPAFIPTRDFIETTNLAKFMKKNACLEVDDFHRWSVNAFTNFWEQIIIELGIVFKKRYQTIFAGTPVAPQWLTGAKLNIIDSCFTAPPEQTALIYQDNNKKLKKISYGELNRLSNRIANSLLSRDLGPNDAIAIAMPMTIEAVACYLGIIKMGGIVVSIADSFASDEIALRLKIANAKAVLTQDFILRGEKQLPLYQKMVKANAPLTIVIASSDSTMTLRQGDIHWQHFLENNDIFESLACDPQTHCNILFSSGTTGTPKAIPWNHTTGIKVASDAFFHQNIQPEDVLAWPTNLGWMMGPWLVFAALINRAVIAIYSDVPRDEQFGRFVQDAKVTMLGVIPTLVSAWRQSQCMENCDWTNVKVFSSTGECSNASDMLYLMSLANYQPIIEYCGGTEIGGSYVTSTVIQKNYPSVFTTPTFGLDFLLLDENGLPDDQGEVALIPPAIGLSTELLNADHDQIYYADMPKTPDGKTLRRHGDEAIRLKKNFYQILGRVDDTMNLGGIKISSAEIERALVGIEGVTETAAIAIAPSHNGPSQLIIYAVAPNPLDKDSLIKAMQQKIHDNLNPLFKIHDVVIVSELPKTASNKIMRRLLRST